MFLHLYRRIVGYLFRAFNPEYSNKQRIVWGIKSLAYLGVAGVLAFCLYIALLIPFTPSISELRKGKIDQPAQLLSADGELIATYKRVNHEVVDLKNISPHVVNALIATEDHRFYQHHGIDFLRTGASAVRTLVGRTEGGSTITQQLARNLYPEEIGRKRTVTRKLKEIITALKIEWVYSKKEILEKYLNTVPFLYNAFGIEMAARTYFDKPSSKLNVLESATLIGMLKGNSYYNPALNPERAVERRNVVLAQMVKHKMLSQDNFDTLKKRDLRLDFERQPELLGPAPHFAEHVRKWLIEWADRHDYNIYSDGLVVHTTLDSRLQDAAATAVKRRMEMLQAVADVEWGTASEHLQSKNASTYLALRRSVKPFGYFWKSRTEIIDAFIRESSAYQDALRSGTKPQAALAQLKKDAAFMAKLREEKTHLQTGLVALDPTNGHIKAWVGSRDFGRDQYDHVTRAQRQPGSTFKPFVYGAALEQGIPSGKPYVDREIEFPMKDGTVWKPTDLTPASGREMTMREGLIHSKNTITAQVMQEVGPQKTIAFARKLGVNQSKLDPVPALALGVSPVTLLEMVSAYGTIANRGMYRKPIFVTHITDKNGKVLAQFSSDGSKVLSDSVATELTGMLRGVVNQGTGTAIKNSFGIRADVAGKTGTTQNNTDGWFILMHPQLVAGSWVGFNDSRVTMRSSYWGQGGHNALELIGDFFRQAISARLIEGKIQLAQPPEETQKPSIWNALVTTVKGWFGQDRKETKPAPKPPRNRSKAASQKPAEASRPDAAAATAAGAPQPGTATAPGQPDNRRSPAAAPQTAPQEEVLDPETLEPVKP